MVREYIGARYVPKFMGAYDVTQEYEALCVVDNGSGTSYISKIPTPAGTPLTDTTHWAIYGASSGAIINLQNQIDVINTNLGSVMAVTDVIENATDLKNKKICIIGDSISASDDSWVGSFKTMVGDYCQVDNYSQSGKQWNNSDGSSNPCPSAIIPDLSETYDIFIIFCGVNDFLNGCAFGNIATDNTASTFNGAIEATYNAIVAHNNAAKVFVIAPTKTRYNPNPDNITATLAMYRLILYSHCTRYGWNFIDAYTHAPLINIAKTVGGVVGGPWLADGLHFANVYYPYFARYILDCVLCDKNDNLAYKKYEKQIVKAGFDFLYYGFDTNGRGYIRLKADISNVYDSSLYTLLSDMPSWLYGFDETLKGVVTETVGGGAGSKPVASLIKAGGTSIYFFAAANITAGKIEIECEAKTQGFVYDENFSW